MPQVLLNLNHTTVPAEAHGFVESCGHIPAEAENTTVNTSDGNVMYGTIPGYDRTVSGGNTVACNC